MHDQTISIVFQKYPILTDSSLCMYLELKMKYVGILVKGHKNESFLRGLIQGSLSKYWWRVLPLFYHILMVFYRISGLVHSI